MIKKIYYLRIKAYKFKININLNNTLNAISHHDILTNENNNNSQVIVHKINLASNIKLQAT